MIPYIHLSIPPPSDALSGIAPESALVVTIEAPWGNPTSCAAWLAECRPAALLFLGEHGDSLLEAIAPLLPPRRGKRSGCKIEWNPGDDPEEAAWEFFHLWLPMEARSGQGAILQCGASEVMPPFLKTLRILERGRLGLF